MASPIYGQDYGQDVNVASNMEESVFDPSYGGQSYGGGMEESVFDPTYSYNNSSMESVFDPTYGGRYSNVMMPSGDTGGISNLLKSMNLTNAAGIAGALAGATGAFSNKPKKAYEGKIPQYQAVRNMVTAPPTANYRPGQGGVNWNSNVTYIPKGMSPSSFGLPTSAAAASAANATNANKSSSALNNIAKVAGTAGIASLINNLLSGKTNAAGITDLLKKAGVITGTGTNTGTNTGTGTNTAGTNTAGTNTAGTNTTKTNTAGGAPTSGGTPNAGGIANAVKNIGGSGENGELTTPEGDYAGEDEFAGIDEQVAANENALETPNELSDDEVDAELARIAAETDAEYGTGEDDTFGGDTTFNWDEDMGSGGDYSDFSFGSGDDDYANFDFGSGDDYSGFDFGGDFAQGGVINMARGRYLQGKTDGMADKIPARIGKNQPAALSHGEFVVPADVVSHLGNGNSDAGAKKLYQMMDKIRVARTGNKEQGKQINPDKFMPGGLANAYAQGGSVKRFVEGGATGATGLGAAVNAGITGTETGPNSWAGDYMSDMLGKTQALTESPYQQYMGPLTAGASGLQDKVFTGLQNTTFPGNLGQSFSSAGAYPAPQLNMDAYGTQPAGASTTTAGSTGAATTTTAPVQPQGIASQYMNPYLQSVLDPQMAELRRQNDITNMGTNARMTQAGAFGGGRQAIMNAENNRNLMQEMNKTVGAGYANAYDKAQQQFNTEQTQGRSLADLIAQQGNAQRGIEAEGIAADKAAFEAARENPYKMLQFQQSMLQGMPVSATSYNIAQPTKLQEIMAGAAGGAKAVGKSDKTIADLLQQLGL